MSAEKLYGEVVHTTTEALKIDAGYVKLLYRRACAQSALGGLAVDEAHAQGVDADEGVRQLRAAEKDLRDVLAKEAGNRDARHELERVLVKLKRHAKKETERSKKAFRFGEALKAREQTADLYGDGSAMLQLDRLGDGGRWWNEDWEKDPARACVVTLRYELADASGRFHGVWSEITFPIACGGMHPAIEKAVARMTVGEVSVLTARASRLTVASSLTRWLPEGARGAPAADAAPLAFRLELLSFRIFERLRGASGTEGLLKVEEEGCGLPASDLSTVSAHWKVWTPGGGVVHSTKVPRAMAQSLFEDGKMPPDDDTIEAPSFELSDAWRPVREAARRLCYGGRATYIVFGAAPAVPKSATADQVVGVKLEQKHRAGQLDYAIVAVELCNVESAVDPAKSCFADAVTSRFKAEQRLVAGQKEQAEALLRHAVACAVAILAREDRDESKDERLRAELAAAQLSLGGLIVTRAAAVLESSSASSKQVAAAEAERTRRTRSSPATARRRWPAGRRSRSRATSSTRAPTSSRGCGRWTRRKFPRELATSRASSSARSTRARVRRKPPGCGS